jgi:MFS family permease
MLSALHDKDYRLFWIAMALSTAGQTIWRGTQGWLIVTLTNSPFLLGLAGFMTMVPSLFLSLFAGVVIDRKDKRLILLLTQLGFGASVLVLGALISLKIIEILHVLTIALVVGVNIAFFFPSRQAIVPELLPETKISNGIALNSSGFYIAMILSSATLGWLIHQIGMAGSFYIAGIFFALGVFFLMAMRYHSKRPKQAQAYPFWKDLKRALRYTQSNRLVFALLMVTGVTSLLRGSPLTLMPIFAKDILEVGATGLGYLLAANSIGALLGTILLAAIGNYHAKGALILIAFFAEGLGQIIFASSRSMPLSLAVLSIHGAASGISITALVTALQLNTPNELRGRIMGLYFFVFQGIIPIGALLSGTLANFTDAPFATISTGAVMCIVTVIFAISVPIIRKAR